MRTSRRSLRPVRTTVMMAVAGVALVGTVIGLVVSYVGGSGSGQPAAIPLSPAPAVAAFLHRYVLPDGRVQRIDQGGDTVSEGQAYAMLMTAAVGDRRGFTSVWGWTHQHLLLPDGLLAWHWVHGAIAGRDPASDADLGATAALIMASHRFGDASLLADARQMAAAIRAHEVGNSAEGPTVVAGPWALSPTEYVNPSYLAPAELAQLAAAFGGPWPAIEATSTAQLEALTKNGNLPSDWAVVGSDHHVHPSAPPNSAGQQPLFGFDAVRAPVWMAVSCNAGLRRAAAALQPALLRGRDEVGLDLGGHPDRAVANPVGRVAMAAADWAASEQKRAWSELSRAADADRTSPSYYGAAWITLTTLAFDHQLQRCGG